MSENSIVTDESSVELEEVEHNASLSDKEVQEVDNTDEKGEDQPVVDPRLAIMEKIAAQNDKERAIAKGTRQEDMPAGEPVPDYDEEDLEPGLDSRETIVEDVTDDDLPEEYADDPLAEFIEMDGDEPMFRTVVNGQQKLIPLEKARADLQKNHAADQRLREAAEVQKNLEQREQAIAAREAELMRRAQEAAQLSADAEQLSDEQLTEQARQVVSELFTGTQDEAAEKLADLILKHRGAAGVATSVNPEEIAAQAVTAARQQLAAEQQQQDAETGYKKFVKDYPEIAGDDMLFRLADSMTDEIARAHPDWMPSKVMLEAGKRTREWVKSTTNASEQDPAQNDRRERKRNLRRVPRARQGVKPTESAERPETPSDYMAELKKARGQVV